MSGQRSLPPAACRGMPGPRDRSSPLVADLIYVARNGLDRWVGEWVGDWGWGVRGEEREKMRERAGEQRCVPAANCRDGRGVV